MLRSGPRTGAERKLQKELADAQELAGAVVVRKRFGGPIICAVC